MTSTNETPVIVCQIGAREHYALARTLHKAGLLAELITDVWVPPGTLLRRLPGRAGERLGGRYAPQLEQTDVTHFTYGWIRREASKAILNAQSGWGGIIDHNNWFQTQAAGHMKSTHCLESKPKPIVFAYSYAAREIFTAAREAGATAILGQIDGGEADETFIDSVWALRGARQQEAAKAPKEYWQSWREECQLADRIVVNSEWSRKLLVQAGIDKSKLVVVPVIHESPTPSVIGRPDYPLTFDHARPLRVLYLGNLTIRKGALDVLDAARMLAGKPVQFSMVGADLEGHCAILRKEANITLQDRVPRSQVGQQFQNADVFLFPTHSDGFGMTQIEALDAGLPVIASRNCAALVEHGRTGLLLDEVSGKSISDAICHLLGNPGALPLMSVAAKEARSRFAKHSAAACLEAIIGIEQKCI